MILALLQDLPDAASGWGDLVAPISGLAFAALLIRLAMGQADKRAAVAETREAACTAKQDIVLEDNRAQAATIKEQTSIMTKVVTLAEGSFEMQKTTQQRLDEVQRLLTKALSDAHQGP